MRSTEVWDFLNTSPGDLSIRKMCTVLVLRMAHRKWIETEQQPGTAEPGNMLAGVA